MKSLKGGKFSSCFGAEKLKGSQLQGGGLYPVAPDHGLCPKPRWGFCPQISVIQ